LRRKVKGFFVTQTICQEGEDLKELVA